MNYIFNFEPVGEPIHDVDGRYWQTLKILEEAREVQDEVENMNIAIRNGEIPDVTMNNYIIELMDVIHAAETALHEFSPKRLAQAKKEVIEKNRIRGYYMKNY